VGRGVRRPRHGPDRPAAGRRPRPGGDGGRGRPAGPVQHAAARLVAPGVPGGYDHPHFRHGGSPLSTHDPNRTTDLPPQSESRPGPNRETTDAVAGAGPVTVSHPGDTDTPPAYDGTATWGPGGRAAPALLPEIP